MIGPKPAEVFRCPDVEKLTAVEDQTAHAEAGLERCLEDTAHRLLIGAGS